MEAPFYAQYAAEYGVGAGTATADFDDIVHQFTLIESKARDEKTGHLYHAWDESRDQHWANPETGCSPHFWGRALGWYCMALVDTIELIPPAFKTQSEALAAIARRLIAPLLRFQDTQSKLWYQVLDRGGTEKNYTESSASSMFVYFLFKMIRLGLVPESDVAQVREAAKAAYKGRLEQKITEESDGQLHLTGICQVAGLGGNPYRDGSYEYYVNEPVAVDDFKGVGPFILASMEAEGIC
jgi:unsaturated rhamnogalacturonyl hydrolase